MADIKETIEKIEALAKEDEQFRNDYFSAVSAQDTEKLVALFASKGFEITIEDLQNLADEGREVDAAELEAIAGGKTRLEKIDDFCGNGGSLLCGVGLGVALWSPKYSPDDDEDDDD